MRCTNDEDDDVGGGDSDIKHLQCSKCSTYRNLFNPHHSLLRDVLFYPLYKRGN